MRTTLFCIAICILLLPGKQTKAQSALKLITTVEGIKEYELDNGLRILLIPDASQTGIINLNISEKHADYPAIFMANELLGGGAFLSSRIPQRLREHEGMSYGAGTFMNMEYKYNVGYWGLYAAYNPVYKGRLDSALHQEIDKAIAGGFTEDELKNSVKSWLEQNKTSLGDNSFLSGMMRAYLRDERSLDDFTSFENKVKSLNLDAVNAALRKYLI
jgi:zinc protease